MLSGFQIEKGGILRRYQTRGLKEEEEEEEEGGVAKSTDTDGWGKEVYSMVFQ